MRLSTRPGTCLLVTLLLVGCGGGNDDDGSAGGSGGIQVGSGGAITVGNPGASGGPAGGNTGPYVLPAGFTKAELGGFKLGAPFNGDMPPAGVGNGGDGEQDCGTTILAVVRDFNGHDDPNGHPDFEAFSGHKPTLGMVEQALAADQKPTYTGICEGAGVTASCPDKQQSTSRSNFDQWYRYSEKFDKPYVIYLSLEPSGGNNTFQSHTFFPLDGAGWGNQKRAHNFHFTTEVHTAFNYKGGETFSFIGDDDVWVFINKRLALDLGGLHSEATGTVNLDSAAAMLGLTKGQNYPLDLFHAERHTSNSNFRVDTNLRFTNCGSIVSEPPR
jgi:fibro-slime domain-containing protein